MRTLLFLCAFGVSVQAVAERAHSIVALDGSGQYRSIQAAIDSAPGSHSGTWIILVKNGTYREKLFITRSNLAVVGEHRDSTRVVVPILRRLWRAENADNDWGSAVVNIGGNASDVTLANLTVHNDYGRATGTREHQFAILGVGRATRIALLNCSVISDGGDAVSLWNTVDGMYYHAGCSFEGWVDYVCPRGWCYITDSKFYGHNLSASLWHDGSAKFDQKFVIRNSYFDGVPGFPLGRHHRDGQIYLIDCFFSRNMADRPIYNPTESVNSTKWIWGERHYFDTCRREGGDFAWHADNLHTAAGSPSSDDITAHWTFEGKWDPERTLPSILPTSAIPVPRDNVKEVPTSGTTLQWIAGRNARQQVVRLGVKGSPPAVAVVEASSYATGSLQPSTQYYWSVDTITERDTVRGPIWQFRTTSL